VRIAEKAGPSRTPSYIAAHVLKALEIIGSTLGVGRQQLARELGIGEGTVRTLVRRLKGEELIEISRGGMSLTEKGADMLNDMLERMRSTELRETGITVGKSNFAVLVKGSAKHVQNGVEQRDSALIVGARGATTLTYRGGQLRIPGLGMDIPSKLENELISKLEPSEGDVLIIGAADEPLMAELGAKAAALELIEKSA